MEGSYVQNLESGADINTIRNKFPDSVLVYAGFVDKYDNGDCVYFTVESPIVIGKPKYFSYLISIPEGSKLKEVKPGLYAIVKNDDN